MLRAVRLVLFALVLCNAACAATRSDAALIRVEGVEQAFERPDELLLRGEGFPAGMRGEARLRGALYPAGRPPVAIDLRLPCRALGTRKARVELSAAAKLGSEGPFEGLVEVRFGTRADAQLLGRLEQALLRIGPSQEIEAQFALSQAARRFQRTLGIEALEQDERGLRVAALAEGTPAARAGLTTHDLLVRMDGRPLQLVRDLVAAGSEREVVVEVRRAGESATRIVRISTGSTEATPDLILIALALLWGVGGGIVLMSGLPSHLLWAPERREYWLLVCCGVCSVCLGALVVRNVDPLLSRVCEALVLGALASAACVYLRRRLVPTIRTGKDPDLAPLL